MMNNKIGVLVLIVLAIGVAIMAKSYFEKKAEEKASQQHMEQVFKREKVMDPSEAGSEGLLN